jgi:hypothetical protein
MSLDAAVGSVSVPIVVELLLGVMVRRVIRTEVTVSGPGQTSAKPRSGRSQAKSAKPIVHPNPRSSPSRPRRWLC